MPYQRWMRRLTDLEVNNGAMMAMDYQTGEIVAYVGSAGYYRDDLSSPEFQPQFDVLGDGWRQPGSAFKPFNYVTGINAGTMTAASMFMDVTTVFADGTNAYIAQELRPAGARPPPDAQRAAVVAQHPGGEGARLERHRQRLRHGSALRHDLPDRAAARRAVADAGHGGDPPARRDGVLRHDGQQRQLHRLHANPAHHGPGRSRPGRPLRSAAGPGRGQPPGRVRDD